MRATDANELAVAGAIGIVNGFSTGSGAGILGTFRVSVRIADGLADAVRSAAAMFPGGCSRSTLGNRFPERICIGDIVACTVGERDNRPDTDTDAVALHAAAGMRSGGFSFTIYGGFGDCVSAADDFTLTDDFIVAAGFAVTALFGIAGTNCFADTVCATNANALDNALPLRLSVRFSGAICFGHSRSVCICHRRAVCFCERCATWTHLGCFVSATVAERNVREVEGFF